MEFNQILSQKNTKILLTAAIVCVSFFFLAKGITEVIGFKSRSVFYGRQITISGHGEYKAVADIAEISFSVKAEKSTQALADSEVTTKINSAVAYLKSQGIAEKDIKLQSNSTNEQYDYGAPCYKGDCVPVKPKVSGYQVYRSVTARIKGSDDLKVSNIVAELNKLGVTDMQGPNYVMEDPQVLQDMARLDAIKNAKEKAKTYQKALGIRFGRIVDINESGTPNYPIAYGGMMDAKAINVSSAPAELPRGENTVTADVNISFEIR